MSITPWQIKQDTVTKIASSSNSVLISRQYKIGQQMSWLRIIKVAGESAPTLSDFSNEGVSIFQLDPSRELFETTILVDIYVICNDGGAPGDYGKLEIFTDYRTLLNPNGGIDTNIQDQTTRPFDAHFVELEGTTTTISVQADPGDTQLTLADPTDFVDGVTIGINSGTGEFYFGEQVGAAAGSVINIDSPIDGTFPVGSVVFILIKNMNVDGSGTTRIFRFGPGGGGIEIDLTRFSIYLQDATAMDDARFGGGSALTYGIVLRINRSGVLVNLWNAKTNGELALICASDLYYTTNAPAGSYGARGRNTYNGRDKHGVAIRLKEGEFVELLVQDNLTTQEVFHVMAQGHFVD